MAAYKCVLLGLRGKVESIIEFSAFTEGRALKKARATLHEAPPQCLAFELWRDKKLIARGLGHRKFGH